MKNMFNKTVALILIVTMFLFPSFTLPVTSIDVKDDFNEPTLMNEGTEINDLPLVSETEDSFIIISDIEILAQKAIEAINEMAELHPQFYKAFQYDNITNIRELYSPTGNLTIAYVFELKDINDFSYVVMNATTQEFMQIGAGKSPYLMYLEENNKLELEKNEIFIYDSIGCWVGTVQDNEITIIDTYTNDVIATEKKTTLR